MTMVSPECDIPMLDLELVRGCNLQCRWCEVDKSRPPRFMSLELFSRLAHEARRRRIGYRRFSIFLGGEPLLHPQFGRTLQILRDSGFREAGYRKIQAFTNGVLLGMDRIREIFETGVLTRLYISIDGIGDDASYAYMRPPAQLPETVENIRRFMAERARTGSSLEVVISSIIPRQHQVPFHVPSLPDIQASLKNLFLPLGITDYEHRFLRDEYNNPDWEMPKTRNPLRPCFLAKDRKLVVLYNGDVSICSRHLNGEHVIGQVRTMDLLDAWSIPEFRRIRRARRVGDFEYGSKFCRECDCGAYCTESADTTGIPKEGIE